MQSDCAYQRIDIFVYMHPGDLQPKAFRAQKRAKSGLVRTCIYLSVLIVNKQSECLQYYVFVEYDMC